MGKFCIQHNEKSSPTITGEVCWSRPPLLSCDTHPMPRFTLLHFEFTPQLEYCATKRAVRIYHNTLQPFASYRSELRRKQVVKLSSYNFLKLVLCEALNCSNLYGTDTR